jgi:hypothetical protein
VNSDIPNSRIPTDFADKSAEFVDKPAEWTVDSALTVNSIEHV